MANFLGRTRDAGPPGDKYLMDPGVVSEFARRKESP